MELTDDEIFYMRSGMKDDGVFKDEMIDALCDMAIAHNAAKRQEPVAWMNKAANVFAQHPEGAKNFGCDTPLFAAPPDLAHNAAKRQEPWYSTDIPLEYITKAADGTQFRNVCPLPAHAIAWQVAAPPDLAHNAAKRQEPVARKDTVIDKPSFGPERKYPKLFGEGNWRHLPDGTKLYTTPPDLAAKLAEARELITEASALLKDTTASYPKRHNRLIREFNDFLARTK